MTAAARVALVVDNTRTQKQRSKRSAPTQSFLTNKLGFKRLANVLAFFANPHTKVPVPAALLGSDDFCFSAVDRKHLDTAIERAENEFFAIKANLNSGKRIFSPTVQQAAEEYLKHR
jgi:hypothetical protein